MLVSNSNAGLSLKAHKNEIDDIQMKDLFKKDPTRFDKFSIKLNDILFDFSKNIITKQTIDLLVELANSVHLKTKIEAMFNGEKINTTENRAVLHTALRNPKTEPILVDGHNVMPDIHEVLNKMEHFVQNLHAGKHLGYSGKQITDIVNIGIGGSDLGPAMVCEALQFYSVNGIKSHFVSNVDGTDIISTCNKLNPDTTLFVVASKTFTTQETITNALAAKKGLIDKIDNTATDSNSSINSIIAKHFIALSTNVPACVEFGIDAVNVFPFGDGVGGRYSLWSAIGLSIALSIGMKNFRELLAGGYEMDCHFRSAPFEKNIPVMMALIGCWYHNFGDIKTHCVIPYDQYLRRFPAFLQQMDMESNGKYITKFNQKVDYSTGPVLGGEIGTNAQHSFFQLIHQGTQLIPIDFIAAVRNINNDGEQHNILLSNFFAQSEALMKGKTEAEVLAELQAENKPKEEIDALLPHKVFQGNKPSNTFLINKISPKTIGMLIAMYEHKVFVQGAIGNINQFDQGGVELGKQLAKTILAELQSNRIITSHDSSTNGLMNYVGVQQK